MKPETVGNELKTRRSTGVLKPPCVRRKYGNFVKKQSIAIVLSFNAPNASWIQFRMYSKSSYLPWTRNFCNLYALIICINAYDSEDFPLLHSAIRDGLRFKKYLTDKLTVPESQIRTLIGPSASRINIINALAFFQDDQRIKTGDPIVIFFAGHGNEILAPPSWLSDTRPCIQSIVPQDYCSIRGLEVPCIPDRTIGAFLRAIAKKKGNNITVVFDCCHAASGTRSSGDRARSGNKPIVICTEDLDCDIWGTDEGTEYPAPESRHDGLFSHTLIAACGPSELAVECGEYGRFSNAFINLINTIPPDELRYSQILDLMDSIRGQNPQIEGVDLDRFLFNAGPHTPPPPAHHTLVYEPKSDSHLILLGTAHGVTDGTLFDVKSDGSPNAMHIGTLTVRKSMPFYSFVGPYKDSPALPKSTAVAVQMKAGVRSHPLCMYISRDSNQGVNYQASHQYLASIINDTKYNLQNVLLVDDPQKAHYKVFKSTSKVTFQLLDQKLGHHNHYFRLPLSIDKIAAALEAASDLRWELDRTNEDVSDLMEDIYLSVHLLEEKAIKFTETDVLTEMAPVDNKDLCVNNQLDLVIKSERRIGFKITNTGDRPVYPVLQYFDLRELSKIITLYQPPIGGPYNLEAPLRGNGSLTIGYGAGGMPPLSLALQPNQDLAVGYFKLSAFTRPLDFGLDGAIGHGKNQRRDRLEDTWGTYTIPVTLRHHPVQTPVVSTPLSSQWPNRSQRAAPIFPEPMFNRSFSTPTQSSVRMK